MKILIIMSISTNIHRPYVCDTLCPYISLVNNSIDQITTYWSTLINYMMDIMWPISQSHFHISYLCSLK